MKVRTCIMAWAVSVAACAEMLPLHEVSARMADTRARAASEIPEYTVLRRYTLTTGDNSHAAEMTVRLRHLSRGKKKFEILSEHGASMIGRRVFRHLLQAEEDAAHHNVRVSTENYKFALEGMALVDGRRCYVLRLTPRNPGKYLIRGRAWVDAEDFAVVRVEGEPVDTGSFWIRSTHLVQTYRKVAGFWLPASIESNSEVRLFGRAHLSIQSLDYKIGPGDTGDRASLNLPQPSRGGDALASDEVRPSN
jgi:hypothetical protein